MAKTYKIPGVYVEEISTLPPSIASVDTSIPAFIGYTEKAEREDQSLISPAIQSTKISSLQEYHEYFGKGPQRKFEVYLDSANRISGIAYGRQYYLYDCLQLFFLNGGSDCYIVSAGLYDHRAQPSLTDLLVGLNLLEKQDEPTLILSPDAMGLADPEDMYTFYREALQQCALLRDRFVICNLRNGKDTDHSIETGEFRDKIGSAHLRYGAAYAPWLRVNLQREIRFGDITLKRNAADGPVIPWESLTSDRIDWPSTDTFDPEKEELLKIRFPFCKQVIRAITGMLNVLPPDSSLAGVYVSNDINRGVWKAPANIALSGATDLVYHFTDSEQESLYVDPDRGISINTLRTFPGKGIRVWGARTLAGNDNEWRYIPVRRYFIFVEESVKKGTSQFVFEPNNVNTWVKVRSMIENFLTLQWKAGALAGAKTEDAFLVKVGLGETMTVLDIQEGRMNIEIGLAIVRPAEFVVLKFSHKMLES